jgi:hypothetical protein
VLSRAVGLTSWPPVVGPSPSLWNDGGSLLCRSEPSDDRVEPLHDLLYQIDDYQAVIRRDQW